MLYCYALKFRYPADIPPYYFLVENAFYGDMSEYFTLSLCMFQFMVLFRELVLVCYILKFFLT